VSAYQRFISRAHAVSRRRVDFKLCLRTNAWVAAAQVLVEALTSEANRLLSLDLPSLEDGRQLPGWAAAAILRPFTMRWVVGIHYLWSARIDYVLH
jgi:hypothetical protein